MIDKPSDAEEIEIPFDLLPCPFCGSQEFSVTTHARWVWQIGCENCFSRGPIAPNRNEAFKFWNKHSADVSSAKELEVLKGFNSKLRQELYQNSMKAAEMFLSVNQSKAEVVKTMFDLFTWNVPSIGGLFDVSEGWKETVDLLIKHKRLEYVPSNPLAIPMADPPFLVKIRKPDEE